VLMLCNGTASKQRAYGGSITYKRIPTQQTGQRAGIRHSFCAELCARFLSPWGDPRWSVSDGDFSPRSTGQHSTSAGSEWPGSDLRFR
jgi:hypothetical protein